MQVLPYKTLLQALELPDVRHLEDFIIQECIYPGLLKCKFDQKAQCVQVQDVYNRDVRPERVAELSTSLEDMCAPRCSACATWRAAPAACCCKMLATAIHSAASALHTPGVLQARLGAECDG